MKNCLAIAALALVTLTSGCASVPMASLEADQQARQFQVEPGTSNIYLYRNETFGSAISMPVSLDGKIAGNSGPQTFFLWKVAPGPHEVASHTEHTSSITINAMAGHNHFVWQEVKMGMWQADSALQEVTEEVGRKGVLECKRAASQI